MANLWIVTNIISINIYRDKDNAFKLLNRLKNDSSFWIIRVLSADKESYMVILNKTDCVNKVNTMMDIGISKGEYAETVDRNYQDL